jgi:hypothetical protein
VITERVVDEPLGASPVTSLLLFASTRARKACSSTGRFGATSTTFPP